MNAKLKQLMTNWKILLLIVFLILSLVLISPNPYAKGVAIRSVAINSSASDAGIPLPKPATLPMSRERITAIYNQPVSNVADYYRIVNELPPNVTIQVKTTKGLYRLVTREKFIAITTERQLQLRCKLYTQNQNK